MRKVYFKTKGFSFEVETIKVRGKTVTVKRVRNRDAVSILPLLGKDKIIMERQYRPVVKKWMYELPAGHIEKGEDKVRAVGRELREETGYEASSIKFMFNAHTDTAVELQMLYFYLVSCKPKRGRTKFDEDENIHTVVVPIKRVVEMIRQNKIQDQTSLASLTHFLYFYKKG